MAPPEEPLLHQSTASGIQTEPLLHQSTAESGLQTEPLLHQSTASGIQTEPLLHQSTSGLQTEPPIQPGLSGDAVKQLREDSNSRKNFAVKLVRASFEGSLEPAIFMGGRGSSSLMKQGLHLSENLCTSIGL